MSVFLSYAHEDEPLLRQLETHLSLLKRQGLISTWYDRQIVPGTNWAEVIDERLEHASIILLLVSPDFLASDYCYQIEMKRAMARHEADQARVIPIALRPTDWKGAPYAHLQALPTGAKAITTWRNRDRAFVDIIAGLRRVIEDLSFSPASSVRATLPSIWNIPYPRNPFFLGRDQILVQLHTQLQRGQTTALSQSPHVLSGLGGIGKTQIATEYAYRYHQDYEVVFWAQAEDRNALISSYMTLASLLRLPEREAKEQGIIIQAVKKWLQTHRDWLLILDNTDELTLLPDFLPSSLGGHLLITTRAVAAGQLAQRLEIETLPPMHGALFLLRRAGLLEPFAALEQASKEERELAVRISQELGGLPLALDQAGAYLEETGTDLTTYWQIYQQHRADLLQRRGGLVADHPAPVATTWSLSFQRVEEKNPAAADLLRLCAFLAPDAIAEEILTADASVLGPVLGPLASDAFRRNQAIEALRAYSLVQRNPREKTLSVHRLVQAVLQDTLEQGEQQIWVERAMKALDRVFPHVRFEAWSLCERYLPHVLVCATRIKQWDMAFLEAGRLLDEAGFYLLVRARFAQSLPILQQALAIREKTLGPTHPDTVDSLTDLARLYWKQGQYAEAEPLNLQVLAIREQQLGAEHPDTASSLNSLAVVYDAQGKVEQAEPLYRRALAIREKVLGPEHPSVSQVLGNLALLYAGQGKDAQALSLFQRALAIREKAFGPTHPDTADSLSNLAWFYAKQGQYAEALPLYQRALAIDEQELGSDSLEVATDLTALATFYFEQGQYAEAQPLLQRALSIRERQLGVEHPYTVNSLHVLAVLYHNQGKYEQAELLYQRALHVREQSLGPEHALTEQVRKDYVLLLEVMKRNGEAEKPEEADCEK